MAKNLVEWGIFATAKTFLIGPDFKPVLFRTAEEIFRLERGAGLFSLAELVALRGEDDEPLQLPGSGDLKIEDNRQRVSKLLRLDVRTINVEIPKDVHFQNEESVIEVEKAKFARTANEVDRVFMAYISGKGGQFEARQGDRTKRIAGYLLAIIEEFFDIYDTDAKKVVLYHENQPIFDHLIDLALDRYVKQGKMDQPGGSGIITGFNWEVPEERIYDAETHKVNPETENHAMSHFIEYNNATSPEKRFVEFLEKNCAYIDWWYKNGDKGKMHYAIPYGGEDQALFYPDFIIRMKSGRIYIFDTKTKESDVDAPDKHNALIDYINKENETGADLRGGVIINQHIGSDVWMYGIRRDEGFRSRRAGTA